MQKKEGRENTSLCLMNCSLSLPLKMLKERAGTTLWGQEAVNVWRNPDLWGEDGKLKLWIRQLVPVTSLCRRQQPAGAYLAVSLIFLGLISFRVQLSGAVLSKSYRMWHHWQALLPKGSWANLQVSKSQCSSSPTPVPREWQWKPKAGSLGALFRLRGEWLPAPNPW